MKSKARHAYFMLNTCTQYNQVLMYNDLCHTSSLSKFYRSCSDDNPPPYPPPPKNSLARFARQTLDTFSIM